MSVNKPVHIKVVIILSEGIDQHFCNLEPSHVKEELEEGEEWKVKVHFMTLIIFAGVKKLSSQQSGEEEGIDSQSYNLNNICLVTNLQTRPTVLHCQAPYTRL